MASSNNLSIVLILISILALIAIVTFFTVVEQDEDVSNGIIKKVSTKSIAKSTKTTTQTTSMNFKKLITLYRFKR